MKKRVYFPILYFLFWVFYFFIARAAFLLYHPDQTEQLSYKDIALTFLYGLRLDLSFAAYIAVIPFLLTFFAALWPTLLVSKGIRVYTYTLLVLLTVLLSADLELYSHWGFRLDATPLQYLHTPGEMAASAATAPVFLLGLVILVLSAAFILLYRRFFDLKHYKEWQNPWTASSLMLLCLALLILPIRGGWQQIPINHSVVYFSENPYANHAGINMPWNLMYTLLKYNKTSRNPYQYMAADQARERVETLYAAASDTSLQMVSAARPNVLFIILESYTAKFVGSLGGEQGVTPNLDSLAEEGVNFTNIYASGDRSEKGMVALLSGYPVQPTTSIIKTPKKTAGLPQLSKMFGQQGYGTSYYYGGELEFANIKSYLRNGGYDQLIDKYDFDPATYNSKWGAHDHVLFERVLQDLRQEKEPFFTTVYTLSSHEPYEIPIPAKFPGSGDENKFRNSVYYTDWALGKFIAQAKEQPWWENTLVVLAADHGHPLPGQDANHVPSKFRIPFILTGGALKEKGRQVETIGSQTDIAATLLAQLGLPHEDFKWSRNLLKPSSLSFAFYAFNDGFGYITPQGVLTYDNVTQKPISKDADVTEEQVANGKAYMQHSFEDFVRK